MKITITQNALNPVRKISATFISFLKCVFYFRFLYFGSTFNKINIKNVTNKSVVTYTHTVAPC